MIVALLLTRALAQDAAPLSSAPADCDPVAAVPGVRDGQQDAYVCTITNDAGRDALIAALDAGGDNPERLTRALALHLLLRADAPLAVEDVRRLSAADRRLVSDGIRARRGRASPVKAHADVFGRWDWYRPVVSYSDGRLRDVDRANIALADKPPEPPPVVVEAAPAEPPAATPLFGCATGPARSAATGLLAATIALVALRRWRTA